MVTTAKLTITSDAPGHSLFLLGNEAIARGAIEAGVQLVAAYPGTPSSEAAEALINAAKELDYYAEWSTNEKVAFGVALGASMCGVRAVAVMKHVGVNVALDEIVSAGYIGAIGGLVLVSADDPGQWSSQNEQDNRHIAELSYLPVLEPSSAQEAKDMMVDAFKLSEEFGQPFMLRSVTRIGHARSDVRLGEISKEGPPAHFEKNPSKLVLLPANARKDRRLMVERLGRIKEAVNTLRYNYLRLVHGAKLGIIASGISYGYVLEAIQWLKLENKVSLLKIGTPYPLPEKLVKELLGSTGAVLVVEELEPIVETHVKAIAQEAGIKVMIHGKDVVPLVGELSVRRVTEAVVKLTGAKPPVNFAEIDNLVKEVSALLPLRPPTMCAGCPHRASLYAINVACQRVTRETGIEPVRPGDIGCYALGASPPLNADDMATCMGGGFDIANGLAHVLKAPIVGHLGDSTFFHSGIAPMINAVFNKAKMTMIVMDNLTTGMTGNQPNPGSGHYEDVPQIRPEDIARAAGVKFVEVVDPYDLPNSIDVIEKAIRYDGPSFVVCRRQCSILEQREIRSRGEKVTPYHVEQEKCVAGSPPFCTAACPVHIDVRGYVNLVREGKYDEALKLIKEKLPFPAIMGRICTHPCESQCKRGEVDDPVAIAALKRTAADYGKASEDDLVTAAERKEKVAIVGGGPAGLMAAYDLRKLGYKVTIFEALPVLGGLLSVGIPEYRLPKDIVQNEISVIEKLGAEVKLNTRVGADVKFSELKNKYDAVFIAAGTQAGLKLGVDGEDLLGVYPGLEFLKEVNTGKKPAVGRKVVVIGGGNVAVDAALSALRLGAGDVTMVSLEKKDEMPAYKEETAQAEEEGVRFIPSFGVRRLSGAGGRVKGVELKACTAVFDENGMFKPCYNEKETQMIDADTVITAIGQTTELAFLSGSQVKAEGTIKADAVSLATSVAGVFAGGDAVTGPASVIEALAAGRKAAISIDRYLRGEPLDTGREGEGAQVSPLVVDASGTARKARLSVPTLSVSSRSGSLKEVSLGFSREAAKEEASRCLSCGCQVCIKALACPAIVIANDEVVIDETQCPGCGVCAQICPKEAILQNGSK